MVMHLLNEGMPQTCLYMGGTIVFTRLWVVLGMEIGISGTRLNQQNQTSDMSDVSDVPIR